MKTAIPPSKYGDLIYKENAEMAIEALNEKINRENQEPCMYCKILEKKSGPFPSPVGEFALDNKPLLPIISINLVEPGIKIKGLIAKYS